MFMHSLSANQTSLSWLGVKKGPQASPRFSGSSTTASISHSDSFQKTAQQTGALLGGSKSMASPLPHQAQTLRFAAKHAMHKPEELLEFFSNPENQNISMTKAAEMLGYRDTGVLTRNVKPLVEAGYLIKTTIDIPGSKLFKAHRTLTLAEALEGFVDDRIKAGYYNAKHAYRNDSAPEHAYLLISHTERDPERYASEKLKVAYCAWKKIPWESLQEGGEHFFEFSEFLKGVLRGTLATNNKHVRSKLSKMTFAQPIAEPAGQDTTKAPESSAAKDSKAKAR